MTGNLPQWLQQIATVCPFLFPFETRHLLFYAITFDRDRALQRLLETTPDLNSTDTTEKVTPRLDKRKRTISREDILKQAEHIIQVRFALFFFVLPPFSTDTNRTHHITVHQSNYIIIIYIEFFFI